MHTTNKQSREYISKNPVKSTIGAIGYGAVNSLNVLVNIVDVVNDVTIIAKENLAISIIEAREERMLAELESLNRIQKYEQQLAQMKLPKTLAEA